MLPSFSQENPSSEIQKELKLVFSYDENGNRVCREYKEILFKVKEESERLSSTTKDEENTDEDISLEKFEDELAGSSIQIFPNPTRGMLRVEIQNLPPNQQNFMELRNLSGSLMQKKEIANVNNQIDLTQHPNGTYMLMIYLGKHATTWKIIKE